jgi:hypothetical protein
MDVEAGLPKPARNRTPSTECGSMAASLIRFETKVIDRFAIAGAIGFG